jgi:hypothetical protein
MRQSNGATGIRLSRMFGNQLMDSLLTSWMDTLINFLDPSVYEYISECDSYSTAIDTREKLYDKAKNEVYERHLLATRKQNVGESLDTFFLALKKLAKDCNFKAATADEHRDNYIRDSFINGIQSTYIRQRLLENNTLDLCTAYDQVRALALAQQHSASYEGNSASSPCNFTALRPNNNLENRSMNDDDSAAQCNSAKNVVQTGYSNGYSKTQAIKTDQNSPRCFVVSRVIPASNVLRRIAYVFLVGR